MSEREHSGNGAHGNHRPGLGERVDHIGSSAQQMFTEARDAVADLQRTLDIKGRTERHPYAMLTAAAAVGYVLGGGLLTSLTGRLIRVAVKIAAVPFIKEELVNIAQNTLSGFSARASEPKPSAETSSTSGASGI